MPSVKQLMKGYQWNNRTLKIRYQVCDYTALGMVAVILLVLRYVPSPVGYVIGCIAVIALLEWYCFKIKKEDRKQRNK